MTTSFVINGKAASTDAPAATPLLWVIREALKLTGTKFGCGAGLCGACMVHIDGKRAFSCQTQVSEVAGATSRRSKACLRTLHILCKRPGLPNGCRNAATVNPARS